jgi:hypothetical protein
MMETEENKDRSWEKMVDFFKNNKWPLIYAVIVIASGVIIYAGRNGYSRDIVAGIDAISAYLGLITFFPAIAAWFITARIDQKNKKIRLSQNIIGRNNAVALVVSQGKEEDTVDSIAVQVASYIYGQKGKIKIGDDGFSFNNLQKEIREINNKSTYFKVRYNNGFHMIEILGPKMKEEYADKYSIDYQKTLLGIESVLRKKNVDTVHVFFMGAVGIAAMTGGILDNNFRTVLYQYNSIGSEKNNAHVDNIGNKGVTADKENDEAADDLNSGSEYEIHELNGFKPDDSYVEHYYRVGMLGIL